MNAMTNAAVRIHFVPGLPEVTRKDISILSFRSAYPPLLKVAGQGGISIFCRTSAVLRFPPYRDSFPR